MLRRLFKGRDPLSNADPVVRREAVLALDAARAHAQADRLAKLLAADPDRSVRLAAIERLDAIDVLVPVLDDDAVGDAAARRIAALSQGPAQEATQRQARSLPDHPRLQALNLLNATPEQQQARIAGMNDPEQLIALALKDRGSLRDAALAHPALQSGAALSLLEKRSRGADKALNRHARDALDGLKRLHHQAADAALRIEELMSALHRAAAVSDQAAWDREQHLYRACTAAFVTYDEARAALVRYGESIPALDDLRARIAPPAPRPPPAPTPAADVAAESAEVTAETGAQPFPAPVEPDADARSADQSTGRAVPADDARPQTEAAAAAPAAAAEFDPERAAAAATERAAREAAAAARQAAFEAVEALLDAGDAALAAGHVATARQHLADARQQLDTVGGEGPRALGRRLNRLGAAIAELRDWQTFVTTPKREALCDAVQTLVDHPLAAPDQAERLKALRAAWRELGPVAQRSDLQLADRFNALAERAFEPCRAYFAEQAELRRANLAERENICDQLAQYLAETDWQRADMKAAEQILRTARDAWRRYLPVDRGAGKAVEARFETLQDELYGRLRAYWEGNAEAKRLIVQEAEVLAGEDGDLDGRINRAKGLQQRWRGIGPAMPRAHDQALWSAFRSACDTLFSARDAARDTAESEVRELAGQCAAELDAFESQLGGLTPATVSETQARALRERLRALDGLPPALRQPLAARRGALLDRHQALLRDQVRATRRARLTELRVQDEAFSLAETDHRSGGPAPVVSERCFVTRLERPGDAVPLDALRRLTLRAEQAAGIAPPPEDESLRLEVQVERLRAGLGGTPPGAAARNPGGPGDESPLKLAERWCGMGPKDASVDPLRERFFAALAILLDA